MIAHCYKDKRGDNLVQDLKDHLINVAELCQIYMNRVGCPSVGYLIGIYHDLGKSSDQFQNRMQKIMNKERDPGKGEGHASAGAIILNHLAGEQKETIHKMTIQMICEAIFSHHSALPDNISPKGEDGYAARMVWKDENELQEMEDYLYSEVISQKEIEDLLQKAYKEIEVFFKHFLTITNQEKEALFYCGLLQKILLSALIDADWLDTINAKKGTSEDLNKLIVDERNLSNDRQELFTDLSNILEYHIDNARYRKCVINDWRSIISKQCKDAAERTGGIYTLQCPTGAGKTLSSLRYAINHCIHEKKEKIYYILPYITIIEQNTKCIKDVLKRGNQDNRMEEIVLELHSDAETKKIRCNSDQNGENKDSDEDADFYAQRMAEPIVFTSIVRFLNTFFASGTRNLRPAHQFQNAVIIFDEIQSLPIKQIAVFNGLLNFLAYACNCTCVLCTATQPLLGQTGDLMKNGYTIYPLKLTEPNDLVKISKEAYEAFKRVVVEDARRTNGFTIEQIGEMVITKAKENGNALVIMNTKAATLSVYEVIVNEVGDQYKVVYLSTRLYAAHRKKIIEEIRTMLESNEKLIVVSTNLIEAGVDFDFSCVIRSMAGMDSIIQAAGRCNREGRAASKTTYIINPKEDIESLTYLRDIFEGATCTSRVLDEYKETPEKFDHDLLSEKTVNQYFRYYFWNRGSEMAYNLPRLENNTLYNLLSDNTKYTEYARKHSSCDFKILNQAFKTASENYSVIEERGCTVFVLREHGKILWEEVQKTDDYSEIKGVLKKMQQYTLNISERELAELGEKEGIIFWDEKIKMYALNEMYYDEKTGLTGNTIKSMPCYHF